MLGGSSGGSDSIFAFFSGLDLSLTLAPVLALSLVLDLILVLGKGVAGVMIGLMFGCGRYGGHGWRRVIKEIHESVDVERFNESVMGFHS